MGACTEGCAVGLPRLRHAFLLLLLLLPLYTLLLLLLLLHMLLLLYMLLLLLLLLLACSLAVFQVLRGPGCGRHTLLRGACPARSPCQARCHQAGCSGATFFCAARKNLRRGAPQLRRAVHCTALSCRIRAVA